MKDERAGYLASPLDQLPMFASDGQLAEAIVGKKHAAMWISRLPVLEAKLGFPKIDDFHGGRPVPLVRLFYLNYFRMLDGVRHPPDIMEDDAAWTRPAKRKAVKRELAPKR